jgi:hypothetical protein
MCRQEMAAVAMEAHAIQAIAKDKTRRDLGADSSRGPISQLQEFVQESGKIFTIPSNCSVLQWDITTRMQGTSLEFRATVAFILKGLPHHVAGVWQQSKKAAQRDTAERALGLYAKSGCELSEILKQDSSRSICWADWTDVEPDPEEGMQDEVDLLRDFCFQKGSPPPVYTHKFDGEQTQAFVEMKLQGVTHTFCGQFSESAEMADIDVAKRVLWYLQVAGMEYAFEPDCEYAQRAAQKVPEPATNWVKDSDSETDEKQLAERKTLIMRVQNRIQQVYARKLEAGHSVWQWQYERDRASKAKAQPQLFRATVHVPLADCSFVSDWMCGQREAQLDACQKIVDFLDAERPRCCEACR